MNTFYYHPHVHLCHTVRQRSCAGTPDTLRSFFTPQLKTFFSFCEQWACSHTHAIMYSAAVPYTYPAQPQSSALQLWLRIRPLPPASHDTRAHSARILRLRGLSHWPVSVLCLCAEPFTMVTCQGLFWWWHIWCWVQIPAMFSERGLKEIAHFSFLWIGLARVETWLWLASEPGPITRMQHTRLLLIYTEVTVHYTHIRSLQVSGGKKAQSEISTARGLVPTPALWCMSSPLSHANSCPVNEGLKIPRKISYHGFTSNKLHKCQ